MRKYKQPADDQPGVGCKVCRQVHHDFQCSAPGCSANGTMTDSIRHEASCTTRWYCAKHFHDRAA